MKDFSLKTILNYLNYCFHPLLMTSFAVYILFNSGYYLSQINSDIRMIIYSIFFISTCIIPLLFIPILYYFGLISSFLNPVKSDKIIILFTTSLIYSLSYYFMSRISMPPILINIILSAVILNVISLLIYFFKDFSLYTMGWGAMLGYVVFLAGIKALTVLNIGIVVIFFAGLTGTLRLYLNRNSPKDVYVGYLIGFVVFYLSNLLLT